MLFHYKPRSDHDLKQINGNACIMSHEKYFYFILFFLNKIMND